MKIVRPPATATVAANLHIHRWKQYTIMIQLGFPQAHEFKCITLLGYTLLGYTSPKRNSSVTVLAELEVRTPGK